MGSKQRLSALCCFVRALPPLPLCRMGSGEESGFNFQTNSQLLYAKEALKYSEL